MLKFLKKHLNFIILSTLIVIICTQVAFGQIPSEKTLLWQISGKVLTQPSYLYGTIHLTCPNQLEISQAIANKFNVTQQLYLELDFDDPNMMANILQNMSMPNGKTLQTLLNPKDYATAKQFFQQKVGIPIEQVSNIKPLFTTAFVYPSFLGCQPISWEDILTKFAQNRKIEVLGLETVREQITVFDRIPLKEQAQMLMDMINNPTKTQQEIQSLNTAYRNEDVAELYRLISESFASNKNYETIFLTERNRRWISSIEKAAKQKSTFFGVGAGHLGGTNGVISLLRKAGYTVTPVI
jgi:uncharacterized protein YbaP (TraB family)